MFVSRGAKQGGLGWSQPPPLNFGEGGSTLPPPDFEKNNFNCSHIGPFLIVQRRKSKKLTFFKIKILKNAIFNNRFA